VIFFSTKVPSSDLRNDLAVAENLVSLIKRREKKHCLLPNRGLSEL